MEKLSRADARLKLVKACDDLAHAIERLHLAAQQAHEDDLAVLVDNFPFPQTVHESLKHDIADVAKATMVWVEGLHDSPRWEKLGTRRWPEAH